MKYHISEKLIKKFSKIKRKQPDLLDQIKKQLILFELSESYPSLRNHKLKGDMNEIWSISVGMNFGLIYFIEESQAYFFECGSHDQVYK